MSLRYQQGSKMSASSNQSDTKSIKVQQESVTFTIGTLAKDFDITPRSIRFYEEQGLLSPKRVGQSRIYSKKDRVRLKLVLRGKRLGFSLGETKTLFNLYDNHMNSKAQLQTMLEMTDQKRAVLNQQLEDIRMLMNELNEVESRCKDELEILNRGKSE